MTFEQATNITSIISDAQEHMERGNISAANAALNKAKERLFLEMYFSEFTTVDGQQQHRDGYTFDEWLGAHKTNLSRGIK